jgi:ketosteroid isomerase-like protein
VTDHLAWLTTEAVLLVKGPEQLQLPYRITLVLQRRDDAWLIIHYHGSEPAAVPQSGPADNTHLS